MRRRAFLEVFRGGGGEVAALDAVGEALEVEKRD